MVSLGVPLKPTALSPGIPKRLDKSKAWLHALLAKTVAEQIKEKLITQETRVGKEKGRNLYWVPTGRGDDRIKP